MSEKMRIFNTVEDVYKALEEGIPISQKFGYSHPIKTGGKSIKLSLGRIWFNLLMPSEFALINEPVNSKISSGIIKQISTEYNPEDASRYLTKINQEAFRMSSYCPTTFSSDALILSDDVKEIKEEIKKSDIKNPVEFEKIVGKATEKIEKEIDDSDSRIDNIRISGAKDVPWDKLMVAQGYLSDIEGNLHGPIKSAVADGSNPENFYISAAEARRGFYYSVTRSAIKTYKVAA